MSTRTSLSPDAAVAQRAQAVPLQRRVDNILTLPLPACLRLACATSSSPGQAIEDGSRGNDNVAPQPSAHGTATTVSRVAHTRARPTYEVLLEKGRIAEEKRERIAQEAIERELKSLRAAPRLDQNALTVKPFSTVDPANPKTSADGERIEDRLLKRAKEREAQRQHQVKAHQEKMAKQLAAVATFHPRISKRAQSTKSKVYAPPPDREVWRQKRMAELELMREKKERDARGTAAFEPAIDKQSALLVHRANARSGVETADVADRLLARDAQRRSRQWAALEAAQAHQNETDGRPNITRRAATLVRPGHASERLYETAFEMAERQWEREVAEACAQHRSRFAPRITKYGAAAAPRYLDPTWAGTAALSTSTALTSHGTHGCQAPSFHPSIDPVSAILASEMEESPWERLYASTAQSTGLLSDANSGLYRPQVRPLSPRAAAALEEDRLRRQQWYDQQRELKAEREVQECTFQPRLHSRQRRSRTQPPTAHVLDTNAITDVGDDSVWTTQPRPTGVDMVAARSRAWEERRQKRLNELRAMAFARERDASVSHGL